MSTNSFNAKSTLNVSGKTYEIFDISKIEGASNLPFSLKKMVQILRALTSKRWLSGTHTPNLILKFNSLLHVLSCRILLAFLASWTSQPCAKQSSHLGEMLRKLIH